MKYIGHCFNLSIYNFSIILQCYSALISFLSKYFFQFLELANVEFSKFVQLTIVGVLDRYFE